MITTKLIRPLSTKISPPRCPPGLIPRPRLLDLIAEIRSKQVALIRAGPGFGKTSLALTWAEHLQQSASSIAWLAIDTEDDEPARFLFYVSYALRRANARLGAASIDLLSEISLAPFNTVVSTWINDLAEIDDDVYLFVDDFHRITDHEVHSIISYLLHYAPPQFHMVLIVTGDTALPLGRLRAHNQLIEVDTTALRFDLQETTRFLKQENIVDLDPSDIRLLGARTEGWPALLRIIAATLRQTGQDPARYVRGLSGALRPIGSYFAEMLDALPPPMLQFMLQLAVLDRFSAPLCQAVTGFGLSRPLFDSMRAGQVLLTPLDAEERWFRFHPLLREYLAARLEIEQGDKIPRLHRRAYRWFASHELWTDAVRHAIAAGDEEEAKGCVEQCAMELVKKGDLLTLLGWQRLFPTELMQNQISVGLAIAWGLALALRFNEALDLVTKAEREIGSGGISDAHPLTSECQSIRAVVTALQDDSRAALPFAEACIARSSDPWAANAASNVALFCHWKAGDLQRAYNVKWIPYSDDDDRRNLFAAVYRRCLQGLIEFYQLRLMAAERCYLDAMELAECHSGPNTTSLALPASLLARIYYDRGRVDEAEAMVVDRGPMIDATCMLECVLSAYTVLVDTAAYRTDLERAFAWLEQFENLGHRRNWPRAVAAALTRRIQLLLPEGRITEAGASLDRLDQLAAGYSGPLRCAWSEVRDYALLGRALMNSARNRPLEAIAILRPLRQAAERNNNRYLALRSAAQLSQALLAADEPVAALTVFREVLEAAASAGLYQSVLDEGPEIGILLLRFRECLRPARDDDRLLAYVDRLIAGWHDLHEPVARTGPPSSVILSLSPRERSILERIGRGQSNKQIARDLGIAPETVKSHLKNIFVKLKVERRAQAVSRAQSLGLVVTQ